MSRAAAMRRALALTLSGAIRRRSTPWVLVLPTLLALAVTWLYPMVEVVRTSFLDVGLGGQADRFVGLENYTSVAASPAFWSALRTTAVFTVSTLVGAHVVGLSAALVLNQPFLGRGLVRGIYLIPWAMPLVVVALVWKFMFDPELGIINYGLTSIGLEQRVPWFSSGPAALSSIVVIQTWRLTPLAIVLYLAGLQTIERDLKEAARVDGAGAWAVFRHVTLPGLRGTSTVITLLLGSWLFGSAFTIIYLITGGGPFGSTETLALRTYNEAFQFLDFGEASALGVIVLVIGAVIAALVIRRSART